MLDVNFFGLRCITRALEPHLAKDGFIVNVSSGAAYSNMGKMAPEMLTKIQKCDEKELESIVDDFLRAYATVEDESLIQLHKESGFHLQAYGFSKAVVNRLSEIYSDSFLGRIVTACSPGFCLTAMTEKSDNVPPYTPAQGAEIVVAAANGPTGLFFDRDAPQGKPLMIP